MNCKIDKNPYSNKIKKPIYLILDCKISEITYMGFALSRARENN